MILTEISNKDTMLLPEIQHPGKSPATESGGERGALRQPAGSVSSRNLNQDTVKPSYKCGNKTREVLSRTLSRNLLDIREESFDSDKSCSSPNLPSLVHDQSEEDACGVSDHASGSQDLPERVVVSVGGAPFSNRKLLSNREQCAPATIRGIRSGSATLNTQLSTVQVSSLSLVPVETHNRPYNLCKSNSQNSLSSEQRENLLPSIIRKSSSQREISRESSGRPNNATYPLNMVPTIVTSSGAAASDSGSNGAEATAGQSLRHVTSTPNFGASSFGGRKTPTRLSPKTRSTSVFSILPCKLPSILTRSKSISQPDVSERSPRNPSSPLTSSAATTTTTPVDFTSCNPVLARKQRIHSLWTHAGEKLGLRRKDPDEVGGESIATWAKGPGDLVRPVYARWGERRYALAEPEKMCMPQEVRERIQLDVHTRKRSLKKRMSNFLTVKLGLDKEEDLIN